MATVRRADGVVEFWKAGRIVGRLEGPRLSDRDVYLLAASRWQGWRAIVATAIALAESEGWSKATGDLDKISGKWGPSEGLWQIRVPAGGEGSMYDPARNVDAAYRLWEGRGWRPWGAFTNGAYLTRMGRARRASKG